jgi:hypothetical protein
MAYENYTFVSWSDGTPLTSERLAQMSLNVEQVRDANDNKPNGLIQLIEATSGTLIANTVALNQSIIALTNPAGGTDRRVNADQARYVRVVCSFPGFIVGGQGAEDSMVSLKIYQQVQGGNYYENTAALIQWDFTIPAYNYYNVSSNAGILASQISFKNYPSHNVIGAGVYSFVLNTGGGLSQQSFSAAVSREFGASDDTNAPVISVVANSTSKCQLYVEDIGGGL